MKNSENSISKKDKINAILISFSSFLVLFIAFILIGNRLEINQFLVVVIGGCVALLIGNKAARITTGVDIQKDMFG